MSCHPPRMLTITGHCRRAHTVVAASTQTTVAVRSLLCGAVVTTALQALEPEAAREEIFRELFAEAERWDAQQLAAREAADNFVRALRCVYEAVARSFAAVPAAALRDTGSMLCDHCVRCAHLRYDLPIHPESERIVLPRASASCEWSQGARSSPVTRVDVGGCQEPDAEGPQICVRFRREHAHPPFQRFRGDVALARRQARE